jgi:hypothetical protein
VKVPGGRFTSSTRRPIKRPPGGGIVAPFGNGCQCEMPFRYRNPRCRREREPIARPLYAVRVFPRIDPISFARDNAKKEVSYEK